MDIATYRHQLYYRSSIQDNLSASHSGLLNPVLIEKEVVWMMLRRTLSLPGIKHRTASPHPHHFPCLFMLSKTNIKIPILRSVMHFGESLCVQVWDCNATEVDLSTRYSGRSVLTVGWRENGEEEAATLAPTVIADATTENIQKAKAFIHRLTSFGGNVAVCCAGIAL